MHLAFVLDRYLPENNANTNCVKNIVNVLKKEGHKVSIICGTSHDGKNEEIDGTPIYRTKKISYSDRLNRIENVVIKKTYMFLHKLYNVCVLPIFPNVEPLYSLRLYRILKKVEKETPVDCVVSVFRPYSAIAAGMAFKKNKPQIKLVFYYLDVLKGAVKPFGIPQNIYDYICDSREKKIFKKCDLLLMAVNGRKFYSNSENYCGVNIKYVNFPTLIIKDPKVGSPSENINFVYAGYLDKYYRNPIRFFEVFEEISHKNNNMEFHIYGSSNMDEEIENYINKCSAKIFYHGRVSKEYADKMIANAECIVNFGNLTEGIVPSKLFEIIGTRKKMIHICFSEKDSSLQYVKKYPMACLVNDWEDSKINSDKILCFLNNDSEEVTERFLKNAFASALPETVAKYLCGEEK